MCYRVLLLYPFLSVFAYPGMQRGVFDAKRTMISTESKVSGMGIWMQITQIENCFDPRGANIIKTVRLGFIRAR